MSNNQQDTAEVLDGSEANLTGSQATSAGSRLDAATLQEVSKILQAELAPIKGDLNALKSTKDKGFSEANKNAKEAKSLATEIKDLLASKGMLTPQANIALDEYARDREMDDLRSKLEGLTAGTGQGSPQQPTQVNYADAFAKARYEQLSPDDYQFAQSKQWTSQTELENALLARRMQTTPAISSAAITAPMGQPVHTPSMAALQTQYINELRAAQGQGNAVGELIRQKYEQLGLDVNNVVIPV